MFGPEDANGETTLPAVVSMIIVSDERSSRLFDIRREIIIQNVHTIFSDLVSESRSVSILSFSTR